MVVFAARELTTNGRCHRLLDGSLVPSEDSLDATVATSRTGNPPCV